MRMLEIVRKALKRLNGSFINHNNEIILIPKFNVYTLLDDVETDDDFKVKLCEWFSRDCCCALRYSQNKRLERYVFQRGRNRRTVPPGKERICKQRPELPTPLATDGGGNANSARHYGRNKERTVLGRGQERK